MKLKTPTNEDDVDFLKMSSIIPWRHDGRDFKRDYPQYSREIKVNWPHVGVWLGLAALLCGWICVINWAIPLVVKK